MNDRHNKNEYTGLEIAVIGMSCRFPGANSVDEFWENLKNGVESINFFTEDEIEASNPNRDYWDRPNFIPATGTVENPEHFDAAFFGYKPLEAEFMDPQIRFFYECCWESLELSGYNPETFEGLIGVYAGATNNRGWEYPGLIDQRTRIIGYFVRDHLIDRDFLSTRIAYKLNLRGPAITMKTACSTGLVAVDLACRGLLTGQCEIALAGAASIQANSLRGYLYAEGMISSQDGHVRSFDAKSQGVVFSEGVGAVALKRLKMALKDRDTIYAVIKGTAVNNDGSRKGAYEAPCTEGQEEVIRRAIHMAEVNPNSITYVETHGTGTVIGDPIEIEGLKGAFNTEKKAYCAIGSVKSNFGHTDTAAGIAGFIKTVLSLKNRLIPPSLHFESPNPKINFENSPFYVNTSLKKWENKEYPLRAGVSSFGVGGTNAHAILEEAPEPLQTTSSRKLQLLLLSAKTETALEKATENLVKYIEENKKNNLSDVAYTLQVGRKAFKARKMWVLNPSAPDFEMANISTARDKNHLIFMFSGQGAQYLNMGREIYNTERIFREELEKCFKILKPIMGYDPKESLYPLSETSESLEKTDINQTEITQPIIFSFEYALAKLLLHWGLKPYAMIGHSIGEYVAACLAGVFSLEDALKLVAIRGKLMQQMPSGAMMSITLSEEDLMPLLKEHTAISMAAVNAPNLCVVSGPHKKIETLENILKEKNIETRNLHTSHAFHSQMMEPILEQFEQAVKEISLNKPKLPYISNLSGNWIAVEQTLSPNYWVEHLRKTVRFKDGVTLLLKDPSSVFLELGPGRSLTTFVNKHNNRTNSHLVLNLIKHPKEVSSDDFFLLNKIGQLWLYGVNIDWKGFYSDEMRGRVPLPTYPFERQRYWLERNSEATAKGSNEKKIDLEQKTKKNPNMEEWFYVPSWKRMPINTKQSDEPINWLIFSDNEDEKNHRFSTLIIEKIKQNHTKDKFSWVQPGKEFSFTTSENSEMLFSINPQQENDYYSLISELKKQKQSPHRIVHLWNTANRPPKDSRVDWIKSIESDEHNTFYSLLYLAKAISNEGIEEKIKIIAVTENLHDVNGEEELCPTRALILGPINIIPLEIPNLNCCNIDLILPKPLDAQEKKLFQQLAIEFRQESQEKVIAFRNNRRWVQGFEKITLPSIQQNFTSNTNKSETKSFTMNLKEEGIYLITGGLGGLGLELARYIVKNVRATIVLTHRSPFPTKEKWQEWLNTHNHEDKTSTRIKILKELEAEGNGSQILIENADVTDYQRMKSIINQIEEKNGKINGIFHTAGLPGGGVIQLKTPEIANKVLAPKVKGTLVLDKIIENHPLDFFVLFSSVNSVVPIFGQVDYFSANAFLDAYASYKTLNAGIPCISVNWDSWQEVGMAVEAAKQWKGGNKSIKQINHPLFDQWLHNDQDLAIFVTHFNLDRHWVLNEHKIAESGKGLAPGVTYLEMARQALESFTGKIIGKENNILEIYDVYFLNPLIVGKDENREVQFILKKQNRDQSIFFDFLVQSRANNQETQWEKHAIGKVRWIESEKEIPKHKIDDITGDWITQDVEITKSSSDMQGQNSHVGLLIFGSRWRSMRRIRLGEKQGLATLSLNNEFADELKFFKLHPALLDSSTGLLFSHVGKSAYIPFAYKQLIMRAPLQSKIYAYCRVVEEGNTTQRESLKFDVDIMDEQGNELVRVKEFTMLQVSEELKGKVQDKEFATHTVDLPNHQPIEKEKNILLKNGILPAEGIEALNRILFRILSEADSLTQVVVSTTDLKVRQTQQKASIPAKKMAGDAKAKGLNIATNKENAVQLPRPIVSSVYVSPKNELEQQLAQYWQTILGLEKVGVNDDFFELGGDSLNVVQLNNELKKVFNKEIPIAVMFRYQTIRTFAQYLQQEQDSNVSSAPQEDRSSELANSKDRLKARRAKRIQ